MPNPNPNPSKLIKLHMVYICIHIFIQPYTRVPVVTHCSTQ